MKRFFTLLCCILFTVTAFAVSYTVETIPNVHLQNRNAYVSNPDRILSPSAVAEIDTLLHRLEQQTSAEVVVVAVQSIGHEEIKPFATRLFAEWGIGKKEKDNGLLILFVGDQRKITFETGYGVEGILPDIICKRIQTQQMLPAFKTGNFDKGMIDGVKAVADRMSTPESEKELLAARTAPAPSGIRWGDGISLYFLLSLLCTVLYILIIRNAVKTSFDRSPYSRYRSLLPYKPILLFLAFIFPLFLSIVYFWLRWKLNRLRNGRHVCEECEQRMRKLNEQEDDLHLTPAEQAEERLNTVDYDVWLCDHCGAKKIFPYENQYTHYSVCPHCKAKAYSLENDRIISAPTPFSAGAGEKNYVCAACRHRAKQRYTIPMIIIPPIHRGGGSGGGFGGGLGGGSFGGGRSGGGGATSGW